MAICASVQAPSVVVTPPPLARRQPSLRYAERVAGYERLGALTLLPVAERNVHDTAGRALTRKDRIISTIEFIDALPRAPDGGTALDTEVVRQLLNRPVADAGLKRLTAR